LSDDVDRKGKCVSPFPRCDCYNLTILL
jgi:hypothetical protein